MSIVLEARVWARARFAGRCLITACKRALPFQIDSGFQKMIRVSLRDGKSCQSCDLSLHLTTSRTEDASFTLCQTANITVRSAHSGLLQGLIADDLMIWRMIRYGAGRVAVRKSFEPTQRQRHVSHSRAPTHAICAALPPRSTCVPAHADCRSLTPPSRAARAACADDTKTSAWQGQHQMIGSTGVL